MAKTDIRSENFIAQWARTEFKLKDEAKIAALERAYRRWLSSRDHKVVRTPSTEPDEADAVLMIRMNGRGRPRTYLFGALKKDTAQLVFREQKIHGETLPLLPIAKLGAKFLEDGFGYREDAFHHGKYHPDISSRWLKGQIYRAADASYESLSGQCARILGLTDDDEYQHYHNNRLGKKFTLLRKHVHWIERQTIRTRLRDFMAELDPRALSILRRAQYFSPRLGTIGAYQWLTGHKDEKGSGYQDIVLPAASADAVRNRQDMAAIYPGLMFFLTAYFHYSRAMTAEIDAGAPRVDILSRYLPMVHRDRDGTSLPPEFIRWLRGKTRKDFDGLVDDANPPIRDIASTFICVAGLPREWRPRTDHDWKSMISLHYALRDIARLLDKTPAQTTLEFARLCNQKTGIPERIMAKGKDVQDCFAKAAKKDSLAISFKDSGNLNDFLASAPAQIVIPAIIQRASRIGAAIPQDVSHWVDCHPTTGGRLPGTLSGLLFKGMNVGTLLNLANRWHGRVQRLQTRTNVLEGEFEWPALIPPETSAPNGARFTCLKSTAELKQAGTLMDNCAGGYTRKCVLGSSHVIRIDNADGTQNALLELEHTTKKSVTLIQCEAPGNTAAASWANDAARWLVGAINDGLVSVDWEKIYNSREKRAHLLRQEQQQLLEMAVGFDPNDNDLARRAYHAWHHEMPKLFPAPTLEQFLEQSGINALLEKEMPEQPRTARNLRL